jgi:probable cation-transporting ATPase 13A1
LTGDGLVHLVENEPKFFSKLLPHVKVFARVAPKQKVVKNLKHHSNELITILNHLRSMLLLPLKVSAIVL